MISPENTDNNNEKPNSPRRPPEPMIQQYVCREKIRGIFPSWDDSVDIGGVIIPGPGDTGESPAAPPGVPVDTGPDIINIEDAETWRMLADDPKQPERTRRLLSQGLVPTRYVDIGNRRFFLAEPCTCSNYSNFVVMYTQEEVMRAYPLYQSHSAGTWRSPQFVWKKKWHKGDHYTEHTQVVPELSAALRTIMQRREKDLNSVESDEFFPGTEEELTRMREALPSRVDDGGALDAVRASYSILKAGNTEEADEMKKDFRLIYDIPKAMETLPQGFVPNFNFEPLSRSTALHPIAGEYFLERFPARLGSLEIEWVVAHSLNGEVWIENILPVPHDVTASGTPTKYIDAGFLTLKPFDYSNQVKKLTALGLTKETSTNHGAYVAVTPYLDTFPPIQAYRIARGIFYKQPR